LINENLCFPTIDEAHEYIKKHRASCTDCVYEQLYRTNIDDNVLVGDMVDGWGVVDNISYVVFRKKDCLEYEIVKRIKFIN